MASLAKCDQNGAQPISLILRTLGELNEFIPALSCEAVVLSSRSNHTRQVTEELYRNLEP